MIKVSPQSTSFEKSKAWKLRQFFWPIKFCELSQFVSLAAMMFFILLSQNILRSVRLSLVVTHIGSEALSFIKLWGEMPFGVLFVIIYSKMCNRMTTENAFRIILVFFVVFFTIFAFVLFPYRDFFHPNPTVVEHYIQTLPHLKWFVILWGKWSLALFYIMGELWPVIVYSLLFWQFSNKFTSAEQASRFYPFLNIFGQSNLLISGSIIIFFAQGNNFFASSLFLGTSDKTEIMLKSFISIVILAGIICLILHRCIEKKMILNTHQLLKKTPKQVLKLGILESTRLILSSN